MHLRKPVVPIRQLEGDRNLARIQVSIRAKSASSDGRADRLPVRLPRDRIRSRPATADAESPRGGVHVLGSSSANTSGFSSLPESAARRLKATTLNPLTSPSE